MEQNRNELDWRALGIRIRESRKRKGYTIDKLSELVDITSNFLARIEGNNARASLRNCKTIT
jgi:transcriptional regulator with XRE-family HTH domain